MLAKGEPHPNTSQLSSQLRTAVGLMRVETPRDQVLYDQALDRFHILSINRRLRLLESQGGLHPIMWITLVGGAFLTIGFTYMFAVRSLALHAVMVAGLTITIVSIVYIISIADEPFGGAVSVTPDAFENAVSNFAGREP